MFEKKLSNDKSLEVNVAISRKKFEFHDFWQESWQETEWTKILRTDCVRTGDEVYTLWHILSGPSLKHGRVKIDPFLLHFVAFFHVGVHRGT